MKTPGFVGLMLIALAGTAAAQKQPEKSEKSVTEEIPATHRPPKGMCRIWLKDVPAAQQPAPTECAAAVKNCPPNGRVIFGDTEESKDKAKPTVDTKLQPKALTGTSKTKPPIIVPRKPPG